MAGNRTQSQSSVERPCIWTSFSRIPLRINPRPPASSTRGHTGRTKSLECQMHLLLFGAALLALASVGRRVGLTRIR